MPIGTVTKTKTQLSHYVVAGAAVAVSTVLLALFASNLAVLTISLISGTTVQLSVYSDNAGRISVRRQRTSLVKGWQISFLFRRLEPFIYRTM